MQFVLSTAPTSQGFSMPRVASLYLRLTRLPSFLVSVLGNCRNHIVIFEQPVCRDDLQRSEPGSGREEGEEGFLFLEYKRSRSGSQRDRIQEASGVEGDMAGVYTPRGQRPRRISSGSGSLLVGTFISNDFLRQFVAKSRPRLRDAS